MNCSVLVTNFVINKLNCCFVLLAAGFLILNHKNIILGDINKLKVSHSDSFYFRLYEFDSSKYSNFIHNLNICLRSIPVSPNVVCQSVSSCQCWKLMMKQWQWWHDDMMTGSFAGDWPYSMFSNSLSTGCFYRLSRINRL